MYRLLQTPAILVKIEPEYSCSLPRLECNTLSAIVAIHELTPSAVFLRIQHRELSPATLARIADVDHERRAASRLTASRAPVVVLRVVAGHVVPLSPESFDEGIARPSLERESAGFDALHEWRTRNERFVGLADVVIGGLNATIEDSARLPFVFAVFTLLAGLCRMSVASRLNYLSSTSASASSPVRKPSM